MESLLGVVTFVTSTTTGAVVSEVVSGSSEVVVLSEEVVLSVFVGSLKNGSSPSAQEIMARLKRNINKMCNLV